MRSEATAVAGQCRLQEWTAQIRECRNRPAGMTVVSWCTSHGITRANYYYRLHRVREACLETIQGETSGRQIVPVHPGLLRPGPEAHSMQTGVDISVKEYSIHVTEETSLQLLAAVLEVIRSAE